MRIISLSPSTTEILFAIGAGDMVVADTYFCDYPEAAKRLPKAGSFSQINLDKLADFKPDLILTSTIVQTRIHEELVTRGYKSTHLDPRSLTDIMSSIHEIGQLVNKAEEAIKVVAEMKKNITKMKKIKLSRRPRVYIEEWYEPPMYSGNWVPDIVDIAGGEYGLATGGGVSQNTSIDKLLKYDPEYIFVSYCGFGTKSDPDRVLHRKGWEKISAVRNKKVYPLNETILNRPGPRVVQAAQEIRDYLTK